MEFMLTPLNSASQDRATSEMSGAFFWAATITSSTGSPSGFRTIRARGLRPSSYELTTKVSTSGDFGEPGFEGTATAPGIYSCHRSTIITTRAIHKY